MDDRTRKHGGVVEDEVVDGVDPEPFKVAIIGLPITRVPGTKANDTAL